GVARPPTMRSRRSSASTAEPTAWALSTPTRWCMGRPPAGSQSRSSTLCAWWFMHARAVSFFQARAKGTLSLLRGLGHIARPDLGDEPQKSIGQTRVGIPAPRRRSLSHDLTRRRFFSLGAVEHSSARGAQSMATTPQSSRTAQEQADLIVHNGRIATQDDRRSFASAVAIKDGRFLAVGTDTEVMAHQGSGTQVIDVGSRTVIPGLNDS